MIRIHVEREFGSLNEIVIVGHALYDDYGKDIVCAAVSATYLCTVNAIFSLEEDGIDVIEEDNKRIIRVLNGSTIVVSLLENMIRCLASLEKQYPKNIKLDKEEE